MLGEICWSPLHSKYAECCPPITAQQFREAYKHIMYVKMQREAQLFRLAADSKSVMKICLHKMKIFQLEHNFDITQSCKVL